MRADCVAELRSPLLHGNATALSVRSFAPPWEAHQHCPVHRSDPCKPWHSCQCVKGLPKTKYATQHTSCLEAILLTDTEVMTSALMQDHMLLTCLGHDLVSLTLTEHSEDPMLPTVDLDCLSGMSKLQHLYISSNVPGKVWSTQGLLSSLDCLEGFTFLGEGTLQGPLVPALAVLPNLTALRTSQIPGGQVESCSAYFTALTSFQVVDTGAEGPQSLHITFGQPLSSLRKLSLTDCHITSMPVSLRLVSSLTRVKFERCSFTLANWLHQALEGATQVTSLTSRCSGEDGIPDSVFQMVRLQRLKLPYSDLTDLPAEIVQLSNLTCLDLIDNDMRSVPQALEQITHLRSIDLSTNAGTFQLNHPLTFLSTFHNLEFISICSCEKPWNSLSMFYIGQLDAALAEAFKHRIPTERPQCDFGLSIEWSWVSE